MMPEFLPWFFIALFSYGTCLLAWAGTIQKQRGKSKSAAQYFAMATILAAIVILFLFRRLSKW